jgi:hypothetical protein
MIKMKIKQFLVDLIWLVLALSGMIGFCTGCALAPRETTRQTNAKAVEEVHAQAAEKLTRVVEGQKAPVRPVTIAPQPNYNIRGDGNLLMLPEPKESEKTPDDIFAEFLDRQRQRDFYRESTIYEGRAGAGATSDKEQSWYSKASIPLGWNLLLLALGICAVLFAFRRVKQASAAFNALYEASDATLAGWIREAREKAATSTAAAEMARYNADSSDMEAARGRLLKQKHSLKV